MSLFSTLLNVDIARRVGAWALIQALPDEDALANYLRMAYMGLAGVIVGSVLTGAAIAVGIVAAYRMLLEIGWSQEAAIGTTAAFTLILILTCFTLAARWFVQLANIKSETVSPRSKTSITAVVQDAVHSVTEGFVEGLTSKRPTSQSYKPPMQRRIRLIN